jgi:hypothetical protein
MEPDSMEFYRIYPTRPTLFLPDDSNLVNLTDVPTLEGHFDLATWHAIEAPDFKWNTSTNLIRQRAVERLLFWTDLPPLPPLPLHLDKPRTSADP